MLAFSGCFFDCLFVFQVSLVSLTDTSLAQISLYGHFRLEGGLQGMGSVCGSQVRGIQSEEGCLLRSGTLKRQLISDRG